MATKAQMIKRLEKYTNLPGMSSREEAIRKEFKKDTKTVATSYKQDGLGSIAAYKQGTKKNGPVIMVAGHMDEIGFMVQSIDKDGFIKFNPIGGWWGHVLLGQLLDIHTRSGKIITGIVGSKPPHGMPAAERVKVVTLDKMFIDIGVPNKVAAEKSGIMPGDMVIPKAEFFQMQDKDYLAAKAFDNRAGVAAAIEVMHNLKGKDHEATLVSVGTVQEEVGLRGAKTSAHMVKPDIAFAIDVTISNDYPGAVGETKLGAGVALSLMDRSVIANPRLVQYCEKICKKNKIPFTYDAMVAGGTDNGEIHKAHIGCPVITLSIPSRYIHSHYSMIHYTDYKAAVDLITKVAENLTSADVKKFLDI